MLLLLLLLLSSSPPLLSLFFKRFLVVVFSANLLHPFFHLVGIKVILSKILLLYDKESNDLTAS